MKRKNLDHRRKLPVFWIKACKSLYKKAAVSRDISTDFFIRAGIKDIFKKAEDLFFHIKRKISTLKRQRRKPLETGGGNGLLGADYAEKLLNIFSVIINFFSNFFDFI